MGVSCSVFFCCGKWHLTGKCCATYCLSSELSPNNGITVVDGNTHKCSFSSAEFLEIQQKFEIYFKGNPASLSFCSRQNPDPCSTFLQKLFSTELCSSTCEPVRRLHMQVYDCELGFKPQLCLSINWNVSEAFSIKNWQQQKQSVNTTLKYLLPMNLIQWAC